MKTITVENKEYSCLDISFLGDDERAMWFRIEEQDHPLFGNVFGVTNFKIINEGSEVEYDIYASENVALETITPIIDDFVVVMLGESHEDKSTE